MMVDKQAKVCLKMESYEDEVLCDVLSMVSSHIMLGRPWEYDRLVMQQGRTNEYELKHNGEKIALKPMTAIEVESIRKQQGKKPSLTIIVVDKEDE